MSDSSARTNNPKTWSKEYTYGPGDDCEMCGFTPDRVSAERLSDGVYDIRVDSGCTGGMSAYRVSAEHALTAVQEWCVEMDHIPELVECLNDLSKKITKDIRKEGLK